MKPAFGGFGHPYGKRNQRDEVGRAECEECRAVSKMIDDLAGRGR
jgi:hypothetical protein